MDEALSAVASSDAPVRVEVINVDDFHEDLVKKVITGIAVTAGIGVTKVVFEIINEKRKQRKAAKAEKKPDLKQVK